MKFFSLLFSVLLLMFSSFTAQAYDLGRFINQQNCDQVLDKGLFKVCYSYKMKGALMVGYDLDGSLVNKGNIKKRPSFYPDKDIPKRYRTYPSDYTRNPFSEDRGHLYSDASADYSKESKEAVYVMSNIVPMYKRVNRKTWLKAEKYERLVASRLGSLTVLNVVAYGKEPQRFPSSNIAVPQGFWKIMVNEKSGFKRCFYHSNDSHVNVKTDQLRDHIRDCQKYGF